MVLQASESNEGLISDLLRISTDHHPDLILGVIVNDPKQQQPIYLERLTNTSEDPQNTVNGVDQFEKLHSKAVNGLIELKAIAFSFKYNPPKIMAAYTDLESMVDHELMAEVSGARMSVVLVEMREAHPSRILLGNEFPKT